MKAIFVKHKTNVTGIKTQFFFSVASWAPKISKLGASQNFMGPAFKKKKISSRNRFNQKQNPYQNLLKSEKIIGETTI